MQSVFSGSSRQADRGHILHIKDEETEGSEETSGLAISAPIQMSPASAEALLRYLDIQVCERFVDKE